MNLINKILKHTAPEKNINVENIIELNKDCVSLITRETCQGKSKDKIISEFNINDLKEEYIKTGNKKKEIEDVFTHLGVSI